MTGLALELSLPKWLLNCSKIVQIWFTKKPFFNHLDSDAHFQNFITARPATTRILGPEKHRVVQNRAI